jgi:DNA-binding XRE family transcriptional regulator
MGLRRSGITRGYAGRRVSKVGRKPNVERRRQMGKLRAQGLTFKEIGERLGVTKQCVHRSLTVPLVQMAMPEVRLGLAQRLKELRQAAGINRASLAWQTSLSNVTIWKLETGRCWPHPATFKRLAQALGVTVAVLTGEEPLRLTPERNGKPAKRRRRP